MDMKLEALLQRHLQQKYSNSKIQGKEILGATNTDICVHLQSKNYLFV